MDLQEKLKYYRQENTSVQSSGYSRLTADLCRVLGAELVDEEAAPVLKIEQFHPYGYFIPDISDIQQMEIHLPLLSRYQFSEKIPLDRVLVFDLETTGLAGGSGTYPFLIGLASFTETGLHTTQYFIPDYGREHIAYLSIKAIAKEKNILLSFNGKSFDYPLLRSRFILNRMDNPFAEYGHLDLLHFARRIWKGVLENCRLETIERRIFMFSRLGDIGGALIPQAYFDFIRTGNPEEIRRIIGHNVLDLMSLSRLLLYMNQVENKTASDQETLRMMQLAIRRRRKELVEAFLTELQTRGVGIPDRLMVEYSLMLKRNGDWEPVIGIWNRLTQSRDFVLFAQVELAKYYEHQVRDYIRAGVHTGKALEYIRTMRELRGEDSYREDENALIFRLERLQKKSKK